MTFANFSAPRRTDSSFRSRNQPIHHREKCILEDLVDENGRLLLDMINQFPTSDPLHLLDEGVMKKMLNLWMYGSSANKNCKWSKPMIADLNNRILELNRQLPSDIHRKLRIFDYIKYYKATEFRTILLYVGIVLFKDILVSEHYINFLYLSLAIRFYSNSFYVANVNYRNIARRLLSNFSDNFVKLYGEAEVVSNIHKVAHIADDVDRFGPLSSISTYPFENFLKEIKRKVQANSTSIEQVSRRIFEAASDTKKATIDLEQRKLDKELWEPKLKYMVKKQEKKFNFIQITPNVFLSVKKFGDSWFITKTDDIVRMNYASIRDNMYVIFGTPLKTMTDFFELPYSSRKTSIYLSNGETNEEEIFKITDIAAKLVCLPYKNDLVLIPLLHSIDECAEYGSK